MTPAEIQACTDAELRTLLQQTAHALVRRDIGQRGVYRAAALRNQVLRELDRRKGTIR